MLTTLQEKYLKERPKIHVGRKAVLSDAWHHRFFCEVLKISAKLV